jgi:hypothetical protein
MAVAIFPANAGIAAVVTDPNVLPFSFGLGGMPTAHCLVQGVSGTTQGNYQFLLTLMNFTYVYIFGEKMGDFTVTGLTLQADCDGWGYGMSDIITYYNLNSISVTGSPVVISFAGYGAWAFLTSATFKQADPQTKIGQFQLQLKTITQ